MKKIKSFFPLMFLALISCNQNNKGRDTQTNVKNETTFDRKEVIYGRTYGTALTMDVFIPNQKRNGLGIVLFISEGWYSEYEKIAYNIPIYVEQFVQKGYTVFAVVHGSNPKFSIKENFEHAKRAIRFIRHNSQDLGINPQKIGAMGDSAGGHLSLLVGSEFDAKNGAADDPVERESCKVQSVVAFFPPTDFFNWGESGKKMFGNHPKVALKGAFTFYELDTVSNSLEKVSNPQKIESIIKDLSPIYKVNKETSPTLIVYGDKDSFIPIQQSQLLAKKLKEFNIPTEVIVEKNGEHDEITIKNNLSYAIRWFDKYLK